MGKKLKIKKRSHHQRRRIPFIDSQELPQNYNETRITLIARDPYWIYANWEIASSAIKETRKKIGPAFGSSVYTLRMYDVTYKDFNGHNANHWFDIDVGAHTNNWYVKLWNDNVSYCGEIGMRTPDGKFSAFARSNFVTTPCASSSGRTDVIWMKVNHGDGGVKTKPFVIGKTNKNKEKSSFQRKKSGRKIYLTPEDIRAYYYKLFPLLKLIKSKHGQGGHSHLAAKESAFSKEEKFHKEISQRVSQSQILMGGASEHIQSGGYHG